MRLTPLVALAVGLAACVPEVEDRPWLVEGPRVIGLSASPAEARPGQAVVFSALVADVDGPAEGPVQWAWCTRPRTAGERTGVTESCLRGDDLEVVANPAVVLPDACALFGPNPPPAEGDETPQRPADPDPSGGYFFPVRASATAVDETAFGFVRIRCDLPGVTRAIFEAFEAEYSTNNHPELEGFGVDDEGRSGATRLHVVDTADDPTVRLAVRVANDAAERYVVYDGERGRLVPQREQLVARWYVTAGELSRASSPVLGLEADVDWTPPAPGSQAWAWVVVTDDRGGTSWASAEFAIR